MTDSRLDELAAGIADADIPAGAGVADIRRRARRRAARRHAIGGAAVVAVLVAAVVGAGAIRDDDPQLSTAAPPGTEIEKFDRVPDGIGTWEFRSSPGAVSRTGERSGFGLRRVTGATDLLVYLTDGGICVDLRSCAEASTGFDGSDFESVFVEPDGGPLGALIGAGAPFAGWNVVVVPGINGDLHAGSTEDATVPGVRRKQQFVGADNLRSVLAQIFEGDAVSHDRVVLAGSGSGGLGALISVVDVAEAAGPALAGVIVDGGALPRLGGQVPACIVQQWGSVLGLQYPDDWDERVGDDEPTNLSGLYRYAADRYPDVEFVLVTHRDDPAMRRLLRAGAGACDPVPVDVQPGAFGRGIDALEADLASLPTWSAVVIDGTGSAPIAESDDLAVLGALDQVIADIAEGANS